MVDAIMKNSHGMILEAVTASDLMVPRPITIADNATLQEAVLLLTDHQFSAVPVVDGLGRPVGVLSQADVLRHDGLEAEAFPHYYTEAELTLRSGEHLPGDFQVGEIDRTLVREIMSPVVYSVRPDTPADVVIEEMVALRIHRVFVVDGKEKLVGVISTIDVLRTLKESPPTGI
jgi:CBS domain-containing protein